MTMAIAYWVVWLIWVILGVWGGSINNPTAIALVILLALLGWHDFGAIIHA